MAKEDYKANAETGEVYFKDSLVATFNKVNGAIASYDGDGDSRKRWISEAIREAGPFDGTEKVTEDQADAVRFGKLDLYDVFPSAPHPKDNKLGFDHPEIYDYVNKNHKGLIPFLYPYGKWDQDAAGVGRNMTHPQRGKMRNLEVQG